MSAPTVADLGEIELVDRVVEILARDAPQGDDAVLVGPGDDAAVLACDGDVVVTTDSQHEAVHFERAWMEPAQLGRRAIAVNASDLGAMGARPLGFVAALAIPPTTPVAWVEELAAGLRDGARRFAATIVGGDVAAVEGRIAINVSAVGQRSPGMAAARTGARPGHLLMVTGRPGRAAAGLRLLRNGMAAGGAHAERCIVAYRDPAPPVDFGIAAAERGLLAAVMDVSDGLAMDLGRMCRASGVGAEVDAGALAADEALRTVAELLQIDPLTLTLAGGEDYELLCAVAPGNEAELLELAEQQGVLLRSFGRVVNADAGTSLRRDGTLEPLATSGWDHFACR